MKLGNYYDRYFISNKGIVFDLVENKEVPIWRDKKGKYCHVSIYIEGKRRIKKVHRLVAELYLVNPNPLLFDEINHKDGNKDNNDVINLEWSNSYLNNKHARDNKLNNISESNSNRWNNKEFSKKTKSNMSKAAKIRNMSGRRNPNFKINIMYLDTLYTIKEFAPIIGLTYSGLYQKIKKALNNKEDYIHFNDNKVYILQG